LIAWPFESLTNETVRERESAMLTETSAPEPS